MQESNWQEEEEKFFENIKAGYKPRPGTELRAIKCSQFGKTWFSVSVVAEAKSLQEAASALLGDQQ